MTQNTDQERAEFEKAWRERPIYMGGVHQKEVAYIWWMQAARRAPAVPVPQGLREAAQAVVERWDTPLWKDVPATAVYIADLRAALAAAPQPPEADMGIPISASAPAQLPEIDIDTANHAGIRVRGYTQETVRQLLADQQFKLDELAMLTRMVVHAFRKVAPDNKTAAKAVDYLKRKGLQGNPLRSL